jgi:hypothetical protein
MYVCVYVCTLIRLHGIAHRVANLLLDASVALQGLLCALSLERMDAA